MICLVLDCVLLSALTQHCSSLSVAACGAIVVVELRHMLEDDTQEHRSYVW